ncbi:MAG: efflux RND transporter periplasmic adaptor subunit [Acidobacteria bacterium]|nr:efflux RND transporter periplasmic adaptor subunit [Acidobacteriota bacterium]
MKTMRRVMKYLVALVIVLAIAYAAWAKLRPRPPAAGAREETFQAQLAAMEDVLVVSGQVRPAVTIDLRAEASGIVEAVSVKEGDRVSQGQELVRLDSKLAQTAVDQAEANLRQAELQDAATRLELDEDTVALKRKTLERSTALYKRGLLPKDQLEQHELDLRVSERTLERAKRNIDSSQARIAQARAAVDQVRTQLQHTTIRAPFEAFVLRRQVEIGSGVAGVSQSSMGGTVLMTLGDARQSALYAKATASDAKRLRIGQVARVRLDSDAAEVLPGAVQSVSTAGDVDQSTKLTTFPVIIALKSQPPGGWVNVPAQAEIVLNASSQSVSVPERCVRADSSGRSYVTVRSKTGDRWFTVEVGVIQRDRIQIRSGLEQGQTVVCRAQ